MRRANTRQLGSMCQRCAAKPFHTTSEPFAIRTFRQSTQGVARRAATHPVGVRWLATSSSPSATDSPATEALSESDPEGKLTQALRPIKDPAKLATNAVNSYNTFSAIVDKVPDKEATIEALQSCLQSASALHPLLSKTGATSKASASRLALLGAERTGPSSNSDPNLKNASNKIAMSAHQIATHPNVEMTPEVLALYVHTLAQLGRSESLPTIFELFAHKPKPIVKDGKVIYQPQNPDAAVKAIEKPIADLALQTAIDAKNLDAALGITEAAFCTKAFKRQKLLKRATAPAMALGSLPFGIWGLGTAYATYWQNTMDMATATGIGVAAISGYFFVVGGLGMIAKLSHKDQMKRVTWLPGTPLRYRWMREEEREALDKIACSWGFKESWRHGEETGADWEGLRDYMGYRQMILDRVEFMEGMN